MSFGVRLALVALGIPRRAAQIVIEVLDVADLGGNDPVVRLRQFFVRVVDRRIF